MMTRTFWTLALSALCVGTIAIGCGEDYSDLDAEYAKMEEGLLTRHSDAMTAYDEMNKDFSTVTVADDWDTTHRMTYDVAKARITEYNTQLQDGKAKVGTWKSDLDAAKKEGREAYQAKLDEARAWFTEYTLWLDTYNKDVERYRSTKSAGGTDPWWYVMYSPTGEVRDADEMADHLEDSVDDAADAAEDAKDDADDKAEDAADDAKDAAEDKAEDAKDAAEDAADDKD